MILDDYECPGCGRKEPDLLVSRDETPSCSECETVLTKTMTQRHIFTTIIPDYPGAKRRKAGYVHQYVNRPATKIQTGYGS